MTNENFKVLSTTLIFVPFKVVQKGKYIDLMIVHNKGYTFVEISHVAPNFKGTLMVDFVDYFKNLGETYGYNTVFRMPCLMEKVISKGKYYTNLAIVDDNLNAHLELKPSFKDARSRKLWGLLLSDITHLCNLDEYASNNTAPWVPKE